MPQMTSNDLRDLKDLKLPQKTMIIKLISLKYSLNVCFIIHVETPCSKIRYIEIHFPRSIFKFHTCVLEKAKLILCIFDKLAIILHHRIEVCCFCFCSNISGLGQPYSCHLSCLVDPQNKILFVLCRNKFVLYTT